jgi:ABC-type nickel/cobalt efflux system permease component RcnA
MLTNDTKNPMQRRLRFSLLILVSQLMLVAVAVSWLVHMVIIAINGSVYFVENNQFILWSEITISALIIIFAIFILVSQFRRLGERRPDDRRR